MDCPLTVASLPGGVYNIQAFIFELTALQVVTGVQVVAAWWEVGRGNGVGWRLGGGGSCMVGGRWRQGGG